MGDLTPLAIIQVHTQDGEFALIADYEYSTGRIYDNARLQIQTEDAFDFIENTEWLRGELYQGILQYPHQKKYPPELVKYLHPDILFHMSTKNAELIHMFDVAIELKML